MIISSDNPVANYNATQIDNVKTLTVSLSTEIVKELDLPEGLTVKGVVSEDGESISLNTENGTAQIQGNFFQAAGDDVNVRVLTKETPVKESKIKNQPTSEAELNKVFDNVSKKINKSEEFEKLLTDLKIVLESNESSVFGELNVFEELPPVKVNISHTDTNEQSFAWEAPEARELEQAEEGSNSVDFGESEINAGEDEWIGLQQFQDSDLDNLSVNIEADVGEKDHIWLQGKVQDNHGRFSMWFDNPGTAAYARQNISEVAKKIESTGVVLDHLGISPFPRDRVENPPKTTFMVEV
tara:strand:+ start:1723 stop:2613 length:891 start_codon:yes stop_codon:yes gene_type:complete